MSIDLLTFNAKTVTPKDDAYKDNFLLGASGIFEGCVVTALGGLQLQVTAGRGVKRGRHFVVTQQTINATPSDSGTKLGRLIIQIDITNSATPISFVTQMAAELPELVDEDINADGEICEMELAAYSVSEVAISNLLAADKSMPDIKPHEHDVDDVDPIEEDAIVGVFITGASPTAPEGPHRTGLFYAQLEATE